MWHGDDESTVVRSRIPALVSRRWLNGQRRDLDLTLMRERNAQDGSVDHGHSEHELGGASAMVQRW